MTRVARLKATVIWASISGAIGLSSAAMDAVAGRPLPTAETNSQQSSPILPATAQADLPSSLLTTLAQLPAQNRSGDQTGTDDARKALQTPPLRIVSRQLRPGDERILQSLDRSVDWQFTGQTLHEVMNYLAAENNITIQMDVDALKEAGVEKDAEIDLVVSGVPLRTGLERMLAKVKGIPLDYVIDNEVMTITTRKNADTFLESRIYDVRGVASTTPEQLVQILETTVTPESWKGQGGKGTATPLQGGVLVNQSQRNHSKIASTLNLLTQYSQLDLYPTGPFKYATSFHTPAIDPRKFALTGRPVLNADKDLLSVDSRATSEMENRIQNVLREEVDLKFNKRGLQDVMNVLAEQHRIKARIDAVTLSEANVPPNAEIRFVASGLTLEDALTLMFRNVGGKSLDWVIEDGALVVTTADHAKVTRETRVYDVRGITSDPQQVVPLLGRWCEPDDAKVASGTLVVSASQPVHREILPFLEQLTEFRQRQAAARDAIKAKSGEIPVPSSR